MLTQRTVNVVGLAIIALMAVLLVMVWFQFVPRSWYWTIFAVALVLFLIRITLRLVLARQERLDREAQENAGSPGPSHPPKT
jgi:energy-coupling factor transporter transmembrane protein EcfT